ncbi:MAG: hypothetical protein Harvfovirus9_31 [Harvfovirus sp.]|uniref:Uncharacterized protein n=1 Tax=Harvfovirus sp. TaxID=2487768 RepID=A0A3G5A3W2_9VIRU|nr:MAG: hypothetical protein Harvfovirus9_31 [Harvfovirus sp.]
MPNYKQYKEVKKELIRKYKRRKLSRENAEMDAFISINDFLSKSKSQGPLAESGLIDYHYQSYENIAFYISILIFEIGYQRIMCMPEYILKYDTLIVKNTILYIESNDEIIVPLNFKKEIELCSNARFIYTTFIITRTTDVKQLSHANMLIIDLFKKTIERYEPFGKSIPGDTYKSNFAFSKKIDERIKKVISYLNLNFTYISPIDMAPIKGLQSIADAYDGMCITYSLMYLQLRIMNPDINQSDIIKYFSEKSKVKLRNIILRYAKYIEEKLKENPEAINAKKYQLYNVEYGKNYNYVVSGPRGEFEANY